MTEVTLSPVPYGGGTICPAWHRRVFRLTGNKFIMLYYQSNPNYVIVQIFTINNILTSTPTVTVLRTQAIAGITPVPTSWGTSTRIGGCRLSNTDFLLTMYFPEEVTDARHWGCRVDPTTNNVTVITATGLVSGTPAPGGVAASYASTIGFNQWYISDNIAIEFSTTTQSTWSTMLVGRLVYNPVTGVITRTGLFSFSENNAGFVTTTLSKARGGDGHVLTIVSSGTASFSTDVAKSTNYLVFDSATGGLIGSATRVDSNSSTLPAPFATLLTSTSLRNGFAFTNLNRYRTFANGVTGARTEFTTTPPSAAGLPVVWCGWLTQDYAIIEGVTTTTSPHLTDSREFRIVRYVDDNFIDVTPATNSSNLTLFAGTGFRPSFTVSPDREIYDNSAVLLYGYNTSEQVVIAILRAPPV